MLLDDTYCAAQQKGRQGHAWRHILRCAPYAPSRGWWCYSTEAVSHRRHMHPAARPARRCPMRLPQALGRQEFGGCEAGDVQDERGEGRQAGARQEREQGGAGSGQRACAVVGGRQVGWGTQHGARAAAVGVMVVKYSRPHRTPGKGGGGGAGGQTHRHDDGSRGREAAVSGCNDGSCVEGCRGTASLTVGRRRLPLLLLLLLRQEWSCCGCCVLHNRQQ